MKLKSLLVLALLALGLGGAEAQSRTGLVVSACGTLPDTYAAGQTRFLTMDTTGAVCMAPAPAATPSAVVGNVASASADSGAPVKIGGVIRTVASSGATSIAAGTLGNRADLPTNSRGFPIIAISDGTAFMAGVGNPADGLAVTPGLGVMAQDLIFNGTTWDRTRSINGAAVAGTGTAAVALAPTSASTGAITPVISAAAEGSHVLKASAGNLYSLVVTSGASAGYVMVFNATSAPADGAVTPTECVVIAANSTVSLNYSGPPEAFATGITAVFSTTGCFTKTISNTAFFSGKVA